MTTSSEPILQFQGPYRFLSNFFIEPDGSCVEIEYQAAKCADPADKPRFLGLSPGQAKRLGRKVSFAPDWEERKVEVMRFLVFQKFLDHPGLEAMLLATGTRELVEGNSWGDSFWGKKFNGTGPGENHLGIILMECRNTIRDQPSRRKARS